MNMKKLFLNYKKNLISYVRIKNNNQVKTKMIVLFSLLIHYILVNHDEDTNRLLIEERKRNETLSNLLDETNLQLKSQTKDFEEKFLQIESDLTEKFQQEKFLLLEQIQNREKEINIREILERQIIELNETVQTLDDDKHELQQQLQSRDRQIQTFQVS